MSDADDIVEALIARNKAHTFMTTAEAQAWNKARVKKPTSKNHWSYKANKIKHVLRMGATWKRLAKGLYDDVILIRVQFQEVQECMREQERMITYLTRLMVVCNKCSAGPSEDCHFNCSRDGSRDNCP